MKMKNIFRFAVTAVLAISIVLSSLIFAQASTTIKAGTPEELKAAFKNVTEDGTIEITNDIVMNEKITKQYKTSYGEGFKVKKFTITGNGKVTWTSKEGLKLDAVEVTIEGENLTFEQADTVEGSDDNYLFALEKTDSTGAKVTINGGTYKGFFKFTSGDKESAINVLTINDGKFYQGNHHLFGAWGKYMNLTINDGEFIGNDVNEPLIWCNNAESTVNIKGGTFRKDSTATGDLSNIIVIGEHKAITIGNEDGTGPIMIHEGSADMFNYSRDSKSSVEEFKINGGTFQHTGIGNIFGFNSGNLFNSKITINKGTFKHSGNGSIIKTPKRASKGMIFVNGGVFERNDKQPMFSLSDNCFYAFDGLNITDTASKEIFNINGDITLSVSNSNIKNKGPVIKVENGTSDLYKPNSTLVSTSGEAVVGKCNIYETKAPKMLEMTFANTTTSCGVQSFLSLTPGATYQFDIDCKPESLYLASQVKLYYKQSGKTSYSKSLYVSTEGDNPTRSHVSFRFVLEPSQEDKDKGVEVAATDNVQIFLTAERREAGKVWYTNASVKLVENGNVVGNNLVTDPDFISCPDTLTNTKTETWSILGNNLTAIATHITPDYKEPLPVHNTPKMWEIGDRKTENWGGIKQEVQLESGKYYKFELDYKVVSGASALIRIGIKKNGSSSYTETDLASLCYEYKVIDAGTKYIMTFRPKSLYSGKNFRILLGRNDTNSAADATAYFGNISLCEDTSKGKGESYGENLLFNGSFEYGSLGNITSDNVDIQLYGWQQITKDDMFKTYNTVKLSEIPNGFFAYKKALSVEESEGNITLLETVEGSKQYIFSFKNRYNNDEEAVPYIYAITTQGEKEITPIKITKDIGGTMNTNVVFEMPNNLVDEKNLRIGLKFNNKNIKGYFTDFALNESDKYSMAIGDNFIADPSFESTKSIPDYDYASNESVWMKEGTFDTEPEIAYLPVEYFDVLTPQILILAGKNENSYTTTKGLAGKVGQSVAVEAGKTYQLSFNAKWVNKGREEDKACVEITCDNGGTQVINPSNIVVSSTEYKETYTFTVPDGINSIDISINLGSAYVSGYFANFSLVEINGSGDVVSKEMLKNGDFSLEYDNWNFSNLSVYKFGEFPENFFSKVKNYKKKMVQFSDSDDFAMYRYNMMLEPDTSYEMIYNYNFTHFRKNNEPYGKVYLLYYTEGENGGLEAKNTDIDEDNKIPEGNNCKIEDIDDYSTRTVFKTPTNLRTANNGNMYVYYYMRQGSAGFWGSCELYKLDANGNRISGNIMLNGDFALGNVVWDTQKGMKALVVEEPYEDYLKKLSDPAEMITSKGTDTNATYSADVTVDAYKEYRFTGKKLDMNGEGVTPQVLYKSRREGGKYVALATDMYYDSDRFIFEIDFTIPEDAIIVDGKADIRVQITNGIKGKGYFADLALLEMGKLVNIAGKFKASSNNYQKGKYDDSVFIFYYDDKKFEDGDWSGELAAGMSGGLEEAPGEIRGTVVNKNGDPIKNIQLLLTPGNRKAKTNANGEYRFTNVKPGIYQLFIVTESGTRLPVQVDLDIMSSVISNIPVITVLTAAEVEMDLNADGVEPYGALRGYLFDAKGKPMANVKVYIGDIGYVVTNKDGMFQFDKLPVGEFEVYSIMQNGEKYVFRTVEIKEFKGTSIKLSLENEGFNWLWLLLIIPAGLIGIAAIAGGTILVIALVKKKKAKKLNN
ncbi:MAG: carboxypeptidase regulatory-like domain-containing protein [Clostridia bacterium]|nr:carboxypeptidase regulatory-like domain-containing protein [Clostridia bacterium]